MKARISFALALVVGFGPGGSVLAAVDTSPSSVESVGILPSQRISLRVSGNERNPFTELKKVVAATQSPEDAESQESKIRSIFNRITVNGVRRGADGRMMALAGDLILREGDRVGQLLPQQTEVLHVEAIDERHVRLVFDEMKESGQPRLITLPVRRGVAVQARLFGQPTGSDGTYTINPRKQDTVSALADAARPPGAGASDGTPGFSPTPAPSASPTGDPMAALTLPLSPNAVPGSPIPAVEKPVISRASEAAATAHITRRKNQVGQLNPPSAPSTLPPSTVVNADAAAATEPVVSGGTAASTPPAPADTPPVAPKVDPAPPKPAPKLPAPPTPVDTRTIE